MKKNIQETKIESIHNEKDDLKDWWNEIGDAEKQSIQKGISDADAGKLNSHSEAYKVYKKWL